MISAAQSAASMAAAFREAEQQLRSSGVFARNEALARQAQAREAVEQRTELIANLRFRGVAKKHALVLAGELPLDAPSYTDGRPTSHFALHVTRGWQASPHTLLILCGPKGCGKSLAAGEQVRRTGGRSVPARLLLRHAWWSKTDRTGRPFRSPITHTHQTELLSTPLLVIDDLGQESDGDRLETIEAVDTIICVRCDAGLDTIVTTNYPRATAAQHTDRKLAGTWEGYLGPRAETISARVVEYGAVVQCPAEDLRAKGRHT